MEHKVINPWTYQSAYGYVQANELQGVQRWLLCAGQASVDADGELVPGDMTAQLNKSIENLETILRQADFTLADVVRMTYYTTDIDAGVAALKAAAPGQAEKGCRYSCVMVEVSRLAFPELLIELEATAASSRQGRRRRPPHPRRDPASSSHSPISSPLAGHPRPGGTLR